MRSLCQRIGGVYEIPNPQDRVAVRVEGVDQL